MTSDSKPHLPMEDRIPGVLSGQQVAHLAAEDLMLDRISYASVDLLAEDRCWLPVSSVKPFGERYWHQRQDPYSLAIGRGA
jgi:hypothetical protein